MGEISELKESLNELLSLLEDVNPHWYRAFKKAQRYIENSDAYGCKVILSYYGGMGSFNDFYYNHPEIGVLSSKVYALADRLWKAHR